MLDIFLTPFSLEVAILETRIRLGNYTFMGLPTDCSSGHYTREQRQLVGAIGEVAFRIARGCPPLEPWSTTKLDGGSDFTLPDGKTVQVMTSMGEVCNYCYYPDFKPLKAHFIVQASFLPPNRVRFLGWITRKRFLSLEQRRTIGGKPYNSILVSQMSPVNQRTPALS